MRIGIDVSLVPGQASGGGQYAYQLCHALAAVDPVNSYRLYPVFYYIVHPDFSVAHLPTAANMRVAHRRLSPKLVRSLWRQDRPERFKEFLLGNVDVVHSTTFCAPRFHLRRRRLVVTIYDLSFVTYPEFHLPANVEHCLRGTKLAIERADALIAISESTRRELIDEMGVPPERIAVTPLASGRGLQRVSDAGRLAAVRHRYQLPECFVLFLGALEPRKNVGRLLEAFAALSPTLRREFHLVVAGAQGWLNESVHERARQLGIEGRVRFPGHIEPSDLAAIYSLATVFAYPSLWEGFGLPVLEAMACGTPVLTSNVSSLPEVAGDAAVLVSPTDVDAIAGGLGRLLESRALRADLADRGVRRAAEFSWERCARETLAVYETVAGSQVPAASAPKAIR
jgi:glycosyltransferase involved in cell wall biosynthesis